MSLRLSALFLDASVGLGRAGPVAVRTVARIRADLCWWRIVLARGCRPGDRSAGMTEAPEEGSRWEGRMEEGSGAGGCGRGLDGGDDEEWKVNWIVLEMASVYMRVKCVILSIEWKRN